MVMVLVSAAASASRAAPSSRIRPAESEPDLASVASSDSSRRGPPITPRAPGLRNGQPAAPMTQPVNRTKRTKSPPPVKPVSYCVLVGVWHCSSRLQFCSECNSTLSNRTDCPTVTEMPFSCFVYLLTYASVYINNIYCIFLCRATCVEQSYQLTFRTYPTPSFKKCLKTFLFNSAF